eukprot:7886588-Pyramimonas_sp.AAC.1
MNVLVERRGAVGAAVLVRSAVGEVVVITHHIAGNALDVAYQLVGAPLVPSGLMIADVPGQEHLLRDAGNAAAGRSALDP